MAADLATAVPPTATPAALLGTVNPSGQAMPMGDIAGWHQVFADDFATNVPVGSFPGSVYGSKWTVYPDGWQDTSKNGTYEPSQVLSVQGGLLNRYLHTANGIDMEPPRNFNHPGSSRHRGWAALRSLHRAVSGDSGSRL